MTSKSFKPILINAIVLILSIHASAQSFIEVTVQDTVMAKADYFLYTFLLNGYSYTNVTTDTVSKEDINGQIRTGTQQLEKEFTSIIQELKQSKFTLYSPTLIDSLTISEFGGGGMRSGTILIYNPDSLMLANKILRKYKNLLAYVESKKTITQSDEKRLYKKTLATARRQADNIAALSGRKIKQMESVIEKERVRGQTPYQPLSSLEGSDIPGWHSSIGTPAFASSSTEIYYPIGSVFTIRFSLQ